MKPGWVPGVLLLTAVALAGCATSAGTGGRERPRALCLDEPRSTPGSPLSPGQRPLIFLLCIQSQ